MRLGIIESILGRRCCELLHRHRKIRCHHFRGSLGKVEMLLGVESDGMDNGGLEQHSDQRWDVVCEGSKYQVKLSVCWSVRDRQCDNSFGQL